MNLSKEVIEHERIQTTEAKAKAVKPELEKLITLARRCRPSVRTSSRSTSCSRRSLLATASGPAATPGS